MGMLIPSTVNVTVTSPDTNHRLDIIERQLVILLQRGNQIMATVTELKDEIAKIVDLLTKVPTGGIPPADLDPVLAALVALEAAVAALIPAPPA